MINFPTPSYTLANENPTLLGLSLQKVPLSGGASTYRPLKGVPSPLLQDSYVSEKQPLQCHESTYDLVKIRKKHRSGLERFHCTSRTKEDFNNLDCFQRATLKENDVLNEIINRKTHPKEANIFQRHFSLPLLLPDCFS